MKNFSKTVYLSLASVVIVVSLLVLAGWFLNNRYLVQVLPSFAPMQFNTALCFLFLAMATLLIAYQPKISSVLGALVIVLAGLTLLQYILGVNFHIDELFMKASITTKTSHAGRMAPNTALCFVLTGLIFVLYAFKAKLNVGVGLVLLAILVAALSFVVFIGYLAGISTAYGWGNLTRMAIHTSTSFLFLSCALILFLWSDFKLGARVQDKSIPVIVFCIGSFVFFMLWMALYQREVEVMNDRVNLAAESFQKNLLFLLDRKISLINALYVRLDNNVYPDEKMLKLDMSSYLSHIQSLEFIRIQHEGKLSFVRHSKLSLEEQHAMVLACTKTFGAHAAIGTFGVSSFVAIKRGVCIQNKTAKALSLLNLTRIIQDLSHSIRLDDFHIQLKQNKQVIYQNYTAKKQIADRYHVNAVINEKGMLWHLTVTPSLDFIAESRSFVSYLFLVFGVMVSFLLAWSIRLWQLRLVQHRQITEVLNEKLESEKVLETVIADLPEALLIFDSQQKVMFSNIQAQQLWGYSEARFKRQSLSDLMPQRFRDQHALDVIQFNENPRARRMAKDLEVCIKTRDSAEVRVEISLMPLIIKKEYCVLAVISDITQQVEYESKITKQAERIQLIYDTTTHVAESDDVDAALQNCLDQTCQVMGWPVGHILKLDESGEQPVMASTNLWYARDPEKIVDLIKVSKNLIFTKGSDLPGRIWSSQKPAWIEDVYRDTNFIRTQLSNNLGVHGAVGFPIIIQQKLIAVLELFTYEPAPPDAEVLRTFTVMGVQIGRVFERRNAQADLMAAEARNRLLLESAGEGIYGLDLEGNTTFVNPACASMLGYSVDEMIGKPMHQTVHHSYPDGSPYPKDKCYIYASFKDGQIHHVTDEVLWRKDNTALQVEYISSPLYENNKLVGAVVVFNDVTARKKADEELKRSTELLQKSNDALDEFAYIVSHDLKEPLRGINNFSKFLMMDYVEKLDDKGQHQLQTLVKLSERMQTLIDDLLEYSRVRRLDLSLQLCNIEDIINEKISLLETFLADNAASVLIESKLPVIVCDKVRIAEVFHNLITNAVKYNTRDHKTVKISCIEHDDRVEFLIADNGIGIDSANYDNVFKIFRRLHGKNEYGGGTGSGLTIVQKIVERHGGKIWIESIIDKGSVFHFTIDKGLQVSHKEVDNGN